MGKRYEETFLNTDDIQMANKHMKRYSASLAFKEMQIKTTIMRYHYISIRVPKIKNSDNNLVFGVAGKDV